jgi:RNA methyltransferase, TrmH family
VQGARFTVQGSKKKKEMLSKTKISYIISLQKKKVREEEKLYVIEGDKLVKEFLEARVPVRMLVAKPEFLNSLPQVHRQGIAEVIPASYEELKKISSLTTPHNALAVIEMPEINADTADLKKGLTVALDTVQDPGNLGTIIRAAAWFGIKNIFCSPDCVDIYNPKVIQSSMGAILHVNVFYTDLLVFLDTAAKNKTRIFGALMDGESIYSYKLDNHGIILLGNESKGISEELMPYITDRIKIPKLTGVERGIDSLNVSMAASVIFSEFTRSRGRQG